jgi:hypothetical protein
MVQPPWGEVAGDSTLLGGSEPSTMLGDHASPSRFPPHLSADIQAFPMNSGSAVMVSSVPALMYLAGVKVGPESPPALRALPWLEALRRISLPQYDRCTVPGREELRWRTRDEQPPSALLIHSPYDLEARYSSIRDTPWVGYKVHITEPVMSTTPISSRR